MKNTLFIGLMSAALAVIPASAEVDCLQLARSIKRAVAAEQSQVLEIVSREVGAAPACACEVVKAAIEGSKAEPKTVAAIVEAAATTAPEQMRLIAQCAVAAAPDALKEVQAVMAKLDPKGEVNYSAKGSKGGEIVAEGEVASMGNPLNFPGQGRVGPTPGGPGGFPSIPKHPPVVICPPKVTDVNPHPHHHHNDHNHRHGRHYLHPHWWHHITHSGSSAATQGN